jgi:hypothetical protein
MPGNQFPNNFQSQEFPFAIGNPADYVEFIEVPGVTGGPAMALYSGGALAATQQWSSTYNAYIWTDAIGNIVLLYDGAGPLFTIGNTALQMQLNGSGIAITDAGGGINVNSGGLVSFSGSNGGGVEMVVAGSAATIAVSGVDGVTLNDGGSGIVISAASLIMNGTAGFTGTVALGGGHSITVKNGIVTACS